MNRNMDGMSKKMKKRYNKFIKSQKKQKKKNKKQNQLRPLLNLPQQPGSHEHHPNFRNFNNNNQDFGRNNNNRGRPNFHNHNNHPKWQNRGNDPAKDNNGDRFSRETSAENSRQNDDPKPKSLVEHLKSTMKKNPRSKSQESPANESIDACAKNASKKLLSQLKTMDKDNVKELINNPKQPHRKAVLNIQAREKLREGMRKQLKTLGAEDDQEVSFDAVESVNYENIPETLIAQIGRTVDMDLSVEDMDLQPDMDDEIVEDKDIEVVTKNLGNDFLYGSEMLLMNGFNLLGESENEADLKIPEERFFPPPLPADPVIRPPEPVPPPEKPPSQRSFDEWEIDTARNPDPPCLNKINNVKIQTIPVIVSHPTPPSQILPPQQQQQSTNIINTVNNVSKKQHENPLLIALGETKEQIPTSTNIKISTNNIIGTSSLAENKLVKIHSSSSQDSFKTPSIPDLVTSTPFLNDGNKTPFNDSGKTPFNDGGKTPFIGSETPYIGSETPFIGSETPFIGSETPFNGSETPFIGSNDEQNIFETPIRQKISEDKKPVLENTPGSDAPKTDENTEKPKQRADETYGEYRRRIANIGEDENIFPKDDFSKPIKRPPPAPKRKQPNNEWDDDNRSPVHPGKSSWMANNIRNSNERKSRFEMNRSRDKNNRNNDRNNFNNKNKNNSPRTPISPWETSRDRDNEDMRDAFNYRFDKTNNSSNNITESGEDRLSCLLNPKPVQFKGSFNKRSGFNNNNNNNNKSSRESVDEKRDFLPDQSRERTPVNNSVELFEISSPNDVRPCYQTLKKIIEIETEINRIHDKIHGIDKVISNLQSERIGHQKSFTKLQHDKKVLLDNLAKRAMANDREPIERTASRESERNVESSFEIRPHKEIKKEKDTSNKTKNIEVVEEKKKRKVDDSPQISIVAADDENKKKKKYTIEEEPKSAAQKAKEREEEERRKRIEEIRRNKQLRREKEEIERRKLEEEAKKESNDKILIINRDKVHAKLKEREKEKRKEQNIQSPSSLKPSPKRSKETIHLFSLDEVIDPADLKMKMFKLEFTKLSLKQNILDQFQAGKCPEIDINELISPSSSNAPLQSDMSIDDVIQIIKKEAEQSIKQSKSEVPNLPGKTSTTSITSKVSVTSTDKDPLAIDDNEEIVNPPTPGSNLTLNDDNDTNASDHVNNEQDYSEWTGNFESHNQPIVHIQNINGKHMVCAAEDGKLYKYRLSNGKCDAVFSKHTEICNSFLYEDIDKTIYTASSDGFVYRIKLKLFDSIASKHFNEPLQVIEKSKYALYVGAKSGNIYKLKLDLSDEEIEPLCCVDALILCMRSAKEGSRHILLISSRMNAIQVRDASEGLLLRTLSNDLSGVSIYDMLLEGSTIYCGSNLHEIFAIDFTTGALKKKRSMSGAGAICVRIYKENLIVACYDGNIYIFDLNADDDACNITGPSNMLLAMDLWDDKIIASTKDKTLKIMNIPT
ncbi:hypothetical protein ACKWTF_010241 [Chironomus riparius]